MYIRTDAVFSCMKVMHKGFRKVGKVIKDSLHYTEIPVRDESSSPTGREAVLVKTHGSENQVWQNKQTNNLRFSVF